MNKIINSPLVRLSFGVTMLTISILLLLDMFGLTPNVRNAELQSRKVIAESLAVQVSGVIANQQFGNAEEILRTVVERNPSIASAAVRQINDQLLISSGEHNSHWTLQKGDKSTAQQIRVPLYSKDGRWGSMELSFISIPTIGALLPNNFMTIILLMIPIGFLVYFIFLKRALKELNPDAVIPERVRTALDTLAEGLLIIDENSHIVFSNAAFAKKTGLSSGNLLGKKSDSLDWKSYDAVDNGKLPWHCVLDGNELVGGVKIKLKTGLDKTYTFVVNASPITATGNKIRGVLITFDDITDIEVKNDELNRTLVKLTKSQKDINRQNKELQILATRDPLTNVLNRRSLFQRFEILFSEAKQQNEDLSCIMLDIDHFKLVNDKYGHGIGDEVIKLVANFLTEFSRPNDLVGRYGGEEFCVVLPNTSVEHTAKIAERIRRALFGEHKVGPDTSLAISASFGISTLTNGAENPAQLVDQSDNALYVAKESGRNRVVAWPREHIIENIDSKTTDFDNNRPDLQQPEPTESAEEIEHLKLDEEIDSSSEPDSADQAVLLEADSDSIDAHKNTLFLDRIAQAVKHSQRQNTQTAVMIIKVESLDNIVNALGLSAGDEAMKIVLTRLKYILRETDTISVGDELLISVTRFRNNEILLLLTDILDVDFVTNILQRIITTINQRAEIESNDFHINANIGISLSPLDSDDPDTLIKNARSAMNEATKIDGNNNFVFYSEDINQRSMKNIQLEAELHYALERDEFELYYHPKVDLKTGNIIGMEALLRWQHPRHGLVLPYDFIPHAEQTGLINSISQWVVKAACRQLNLWKKLGHSGISIAVNLSAVEFRNKNLSDSIISTLRDLSIDPNNFEVEITESAVLRNIDTAKNTLMKLNQEGIKISIDDFGTGYSSLTYLQNFPVDKVKIDRTFISNFTARPEDAAIVSAVIAMSHSLGLLVVAEGVETVEQLRFLQDLSCDEIQGHLISKPLPVAEVNYLLDQPSNIRHLITDYEINYAGIVANFNSEMHTIN